MTLQETQDILTVLKTNYPQSYKSMTAEESYNYLAMWQEAFKNESAQAVTEAVKKIIYSDTREFAPNIALVKQYLSEFSEKKNINLIESNNGIILCPQTQDVCLLCNPWWAKIIINFE